MRRGSAAWLCMLMAAVACGPSKQEGGLRGGRLPKGVRWAFDAGSITSRPTVVGGILAVGTGAGAFLALDRKDGALKWKYDARADAAESAFHHEPLVADDLVLAATTAKGGGHVYAFDVASGQVRWKHAMGAGDAVEGGVDGEVVRQGGNVYAVGLDGKIVCLDLKTGEKKWEVGPVEPRIAPAAGPAYIYVAVDQTKVHGLDPLTGQRAWEADLLAVATTSMIAQGEDVYVGGNPFRMFRINGRTGEILAKIALQGKPVQNPAAAGASISVFLGDPQGSPDSAASLILLDAALSRILWGRRAPEEWTSVHPLIWGDLILAGDSGGELFAYGQADGAKKWSSKFDAGVGSVSASDDLLYVGTLAGAIYAFTPPAPAPSGL